MDKREEDYTAFETLDSATSLNYVSCVLGGLIDLLIDKGIVSKDEKVALLTNFVTREEEEDYNDQEVEK